MQRTTLVLAFVLGLCALSSGAPRRALAAQSFDACDHVVGVLPATLDQPGIWCLTQDAAFASTTGNAITIAADGVTLDCNDTTLDGSGAGIGTAARGIYALNRRDAVVRRCRVRGFYRGLSLSGGSNHVVEDNRFDGNTFQAINLNADSSVIRDNRVMATGGSTVSATAFGIVAFGSIDVLGNRVHGVAARVGGNGAAYGVFVSGNPDGSIDGNRVSGVDGDGAGTANGLWLDATTRVSVVGNHATGSAQPGTGVRCSSTLSRARDNVVSGFATGIAGCGDAGGNDVTP
jgi:nitrous oxidase accessory protein NosD